MDSMDVSVFLAKMIGLYLLIVSILWVVRKHQLQLAGKELISSKGTLAVSAEIRLIVGLVIAIDHSIWTLDWRGLITLLGYLMILSGILRLAFPNHVKKTVSSMLHSGFWITVIVMFVVGVYLTYCGFAYPDLGQWGSIPQAQ